MFFLDHFGVKKQQKEYQTLLEAKINQLGNEAIEWKTIQSKISEAAELIVGFSRTHNNNRPENEEVEKISKQQKELRIKINNSKDIEKARAMKTERNKILHQIKRS